MVDRERIDLIINRKSQRMYGYGIGAYSHDVGNNSLSYEFSTHLKVIADFCFNEHTGKAEIVEIYTCEFEDEQKKNKTVIYSKISDDISEEDVKSAIEILMITLEPEQIELYDIEKCPICEARIAVGEETVHLVNDLKTLSCLNGCYEIETLNFANLLNKDTNRYRIKIFGVPENTYDSTTKASYTRSCENKVRNKIAIWKHNDRYIAKIMGGFE